MLRHTILFSTLLLLVYVSLQSCKVSKTSKKETFDSTYLKKLEQSEIENKKAITYLENLIREMEQTGVTFDTDCDTTIVQQLVRKGYDSSTVAKLFKVLAEKTNKIEVLTDGTVRAEGRIRSYTKLIEKIDSSKKVLVLEIQKLKAFKDSTIAAVSKVKTEKTVKKNKPILLWLALLIAGGVIWEYIRKPFLIIYTKIKSK